MKIAYLRAEMVSNGWLEDSSRGINYKAPEPTPEDVGRCEDWIMSQEDSLVTNLKRLAFLLPFALEYVFRSQKVVWNAMAKQDIERAYRSCLKSSFGHGFDPLRCVPGKYLWLTTHWISFKRVVAFLQMGNTAKVPVSTLDRRSVHPSGTADITTTAAAIREMRETGPELYERIYRARKDEIDVSEEMDVKVRAAPYRYHPMCERFGNKMATGSAIAVPPLSKEEYEQFSNAKIVGAELAPVVRAYLDMYSRNANLKRASVFRRRIYHEYIVQYNQLVTLFRQEAVQRHHEYKEF